MMSNQKPAIIPPIKIIRRQGTTREPQTPSPSKEREIDKKLKRS